MLDIHNIRSFCEILQAELKIAICDGGHAGAFRAGRNWCAAIRTNVIVVIVSDLQFNVLLFQLQKSCPFSTSRVQMMQYLPRISKFYRILLVGPTIRSIANHPTHKVVQSPALANQKVHAHAPLLRAPTPSADS